MNNPASIPANKPTHGLALPMPNLTSAAYVTAAAVNAPANILPSSAMLMTPDRSENSPPIAASTNGAASLIVDAIMDHVKTSLMVYALNRLNPNLPADHLKNASAATNRMMIPCST